MVIKRSRLACEAVEPPIDKPLLEGMRYTLLIIWPFQY